MNTKKKMTLLVCVFLTALCIVSCRQAKEDAIINGEESSAAQQEITVETAENTDSETTGDEIERAEESSADQQENHVQAAKDADSEMTAEELLDLFIDGTINAADSTDLTAAFYITDLNMGSEELDSYSVGEKVDLDNDGENELVISGPYGGIYLDGRNNRVYEFAAGDGNALILSYVYYNGAVWIMYSNSMNEGYESYHMEKFEGADNLVAEMDFGEELADPNNSESEMKYILNGTIISYDEYAAFCSKIFASQVSTS